MCDYAPCKDVMPGATSFSERKGQPPYVEAYADEAGQKKLLGYVMLSTDITDIPAYSGKPVVTLIGMDTAGKFSGVKILKHSEPILLLGIPESALIKFNNQYLGKFVGDNIEIGKSRPEENLIGLDAITGATVTVIAQNQVMMLSGGEVAKQVGILKPVVRPQAKFPPATTTPGWAQLVEDGSVQRLTVKPEEVGLKNDGRPYMDLWFGYLNQPTVGQAILGKDGYAGLMGRLKEGEHAIFIIKTAGMDSFKGSGFVRGGIYDRVQVRQGGDSFTFRDLDYLNLWGVSAAGAPAFDESAIFIIRGKSFSAFPGSWSSWATRSTRKPPPRPSPTSTRNTGSPTPTSKAAARRSSSPTRPGSRCGRTRPSTSASSSRCCWSSRPPTPAATSWCAAPAATTSGR
jgi:NosR/NirI family nitrous oxide reductase transcriptional regulator